eukprot:TRINITY_DN4159_c0_g1_i1.p1 TRINITY_DN4159_c0_g1~~TRINITY_DN4159_c0_g1_i1.p1  ORF type:complete len:496 (+),score=114.36 TRINITY_DN4159_c0_g1_i1:220-1707(+)
MVKRLLFLACLVGLTALTLAANPCSGRGQDFECVSDGCPDDCDSEMFVCEGTLAENNLDCDHVDLGEGNVGRDVGVVLVLFVFLALASAGGIGGGGIIIPMLFVIGDFPPYYAVPLSVTAIVAGSIVRFLMQVRRHHPNPEVAHRPLINFQMVVLLLPMALAGTVIGVLLNSISPSWLIIAIIFFVLTYTSVKTMKKGIALRRKEKETEAAADKAGSATELVGLEASGDDDSIAKDKGANGADTHAISLDSVLKDEQTADIIAKESKFPWFYIILTFSELGGLILLNLIKGGRGNSIAGVDCGTGEYWGVVVSSFVYLILCSFLGYVIVKRDFEAKKASNYKFVEGDIDFSGNNIIKYPMFAIVAGFLAGFLGIGGGMVLGPLLLQLGMIPMVSSATTSYMTLFTSTSSFMQFVVLNRVPFDYGAVLFGMAIVASAVGQVVLNSYIRRTGKNSIIAFILGGIISLATVLLVVTGGIRIADDAAAGKSFGFRALCD